MADSISQKNRTFFVPAIGHKPYAIGSSILRRGGRLAGLGFQLQQIPVRSGDRVMSRKMCP